ncbi:hypothetical protein ACS0TY_005761 [Phlomoides rotata]
MVTDCDTVGSELAELPIGVLDDICTEEGRNNALAEADVSSSDKEKQQLVGALIESPIISEQLEIAENNDRCQPMECHEVPDLTFNIVNVELDTEETCPVERPLDDKFGKEEEVDGKAGDAGVEPDDYTVQQQLNVFGSIWFVKEKSCKILSLIVSGRLKSQVSAIAIGESISKKEITTINDVLKGLVEWLCAQLKNPSHPCRSIPTVVNSLATLLKEPVVQSSFVQTDGVKLVVPLISPASTQQSKEITTKFWIMNR